MRVLVVEDEKRLAAALRNGLEAEGFAVDVSLDGSDGLWMAREHAYDAIVLDILLPGINGYRLCETLREERNWTPILMLTAKDGEWDEVEALDTGADDFLTKPFSHAVLVARLRALFRRGARERPAVLDAGDLRLDPASKRGVARRRRARADGAASARCSSSSSGTRVTSCPSARSSPTSGTTTSRATRTSSRCTCGTCATSSTGPSIAMRSRPFAGRGTGWLPTVADPPRARWARLRAATGTVRFRATAAAVVIVGLALVIGAVGVLAVLRATLTNEVRDATFLRADDVLSALKSGTAPERLVTGVDDDFQIQVFDERGTLLAATPELREKDIIGRLRPGHSTVIRLGGDDERFLAVTKAAATPAGHRTVVTARTLEPVGETTRVVAGVLLAGSAAADGARRADHVEARRTRTRAGGRDPRRSRRDLRERDAPPGPRARWHRRGRPARVDDESHARSVGARATTAAAVRLRRVPRAALAGRIDPRAGRGRARAPRARRRLPTSPSTCSPRTFVCNAWSRICSSSPAPTNRPSDSSGARSISTISCSMSRSACAAGSSLRIDTTNVSAARVLGDAPGLRRVVANLAENAQRHARTRVAFSLADQRPQGGARGRRRRDRDTSGGSLESLRALRAPRRCRAPETRGGSGLGLAIVAQLVGAHGGTVAIVDGTGGGTRVEIRLDVAPDGN